jgi:hypothetical protein
MPAAAEADRPMELLAEAPWMRDGLGYVLNPWHLPAV